MSDDEAWIAGLRRGDSAEVGRLREVLLRNLRAGFARRRGVDDSFLDDIVQEATLRVIERLDRFEGRSRFVTWATAVAIRCASSELRRRHWRDTPLDDTASELPDNEHATSPPENAAMNAMADTLRAAIDDDLTDRQRDALTAELSGEPSEAIADRLGVSRGAVYKLLHDARKRLKSRLIAAGYTAEDLAEAPAH